MIAASSPLPNCSCWLEESVTTGISTVWKYGLSPQYLSKAFIAYFEPTEASVSVYGPVPRSWVCR